MCNYEIYEEDVFSWEKLITIFAIEGCLSRSEEELVLSLRECNSFDIVEMTNDELETLRNSDKIESIKVETRFNTDEDARIFIWNTDSINSDDFTYKEYDAYDVTIDDGFLGTSRLVLVRKKRNYT